ncbi:MAG: FtsQ-type POTRA domain-containing protein [Rhodospirillaceae bacterium]|nr:FtsQ-type POTRA domain-containing protein [Rhodospirillales bacterium]
MRRMSSDIVITPDDRLTSSGKPRAPRRGTADARNAGESKPKAKRKLPRLRLNMRPLQKLAAGGVAVTALIVGCAVLWHSGIIQHTAQNTVDGVLNATAKAGFRIEEITISGRGRTNTDDIVAALSATHGAPILGVNLERVKDRLEAIPSVRVAAVERRLPGSLHLAIVERQPVAIWQNNGEHVLVDRDGRQIPGTIAGFEELPLVVGDGAGARADELLTMLSAEPQLATRVKAAIRVANRRWNIMLDDAQKGLEVRLPEDQPEAAWHRLAQLERDHALTSRQVNMVDLRTPDRMVLKTERPATPAEAAKRKDNGA